MTKASKLRENKFNEILKKNGIGTIITEGFGPDSEHLSEIPKEKDLVKIPVPELSKLEELKVKNPPSVEELSNSYGFSQMKILLHSKIMSNDESEEEESVDTSGGSEEEDSELTPNFSFSDTSDRSSSFYDSKKSSSGFSSPSSSSSSSYSLPGEAQYSVFNAFSSEEEFNASKNKLQTAYQKLMKEVGITESDIKDVQMCKKSMCLEAAVPGFEYCIRHIGFDPKINDQKIIKRCKAKINGHRCCCPVFTDDQFCSGHQYLYNHQD